MTGELDGQTYRCACRDTTTHEPTSDCLGSVTSDCYRALVALPDLALATGYGYLPVHRQVCAKDGNGFCSHYQIASASQRWDWLNEWVVDLFGGHTHFGDGDIVHHAAGGLNLTDYYQSKYEYAIMTLSDVGTDSGEPPGRMQQSGSPFPDPEYDTGHNNHDLFDFSTAMSKRLRATFAGRVRLTSEHRFSVPAINCNDPFHLGFAAVWAQVKCLIGCDPTELSPWWEDPDPIEVARNDLTIGGLVLVRPKEGTTSSIVVDDTATEMLGSRLALTAALPADRQGSSPDLMMIGTDVDGITSWVRLSATQNLQIESASTTAAIAVGSTSDVPSTQYYSTDSGSLPVALTPDSRVVSDPKSGSAALFVSGRGIWGYAPDTRAWQEAVASPEALLRTNPALTLVGDALVVAGGTGPDGALSDAWAVQVSGRGTQLLTNSLPPRSDALLALKPDSSGFVYAGGLDASGTPRDDVWELNRQSGGTLAVRELRADTARGITLTPETADLRIAPMGGAIRMYRLDPSQPTGVIHEQREDLGWVPLGLDGEALPLCPADDLHGGEVCGLDRTWWANVGTLACGSAPDKDTCRDPSCRRRSSRASCGTAGAGPCNGSAGALFATQRLPGAGEVDAVWTGRDALWVVRGKELQRWDITSPGNARLTGSVLLPKPGTMLAGRGQAVLVGTNAGVHRATFGNEGIMLGPVLELCGHPKAASAIGDDTWAVVTEFGLSTVATPLDGPPSVLARAEISVKHDATEARLLAGCGALSHGHDGASESEGGIGDNAVVVADDPAHVFVVLKKAVAEVDCEDLGAPVGRRGIVLPHRLDSLRLDSLNGRAYGAGTEFSPVFDQRGDALVLAGTHEVAGWVRRSDATLGDGTRVSSRNVGRYVEVAWVVP